MSSTSAHDFEEHSEATYDKIHSETQEDTDLITASQENRIKTMHLSSASGPEERFHSTDGKSNCENLSVADKMNMCLSAVNHFISADDPSETKNNNTKREMVKDSAEISINQENEINIPQHSPATNHEGSYETTNESKCTQQQCVIPTSNTTGSNTQPDVSDSSHHMDALRKDERFICKMCDKYFPSASKLKIHIRMHTGEKPYECKVCGKSFTTNGELTTHKRMHAGNKPYECKECGKSFSQNSHLTTHYLNHTGETA